VATRLLGLAFYQPNIATTKEHNMAKNPKSNFETITPKKAQEYLEHNTRNRRVRKRTVYFYARQMQEGEWAANGEPIIFSQDGTLLDGQHRLMACVEANKSFRTLVVRGAPDDAFTTIDQSIPRSGGDVVGLAGISHANRKAAAARIIMAIDEADAKGLRPNLGTKRSLAETLECVQANDKWLDDSCTIIRQEQGPSICKPPAVFAACHTLFARKNRKKADAFFEQLTSGTGLKKTDPVYKLRSVLIMVHNQPNVRRKKSWILGLTIKAWNFFLEGKKVGNLKFSDKEAWPKIRAR
jgi:hypothetical protein